MHDPLYHLQQVPVVVKSDGGLFQRLRRSTYTVRGPLMRMSETLVSHISGSSGPRPNVSSRTSLTSRSRSAMLNISALRWHSASAWRRTSRRSRPSAIVPIDDRSIALMTCWCSSRFSARNQGSLGRARGRNIVRCAVAGGGAMAIGRQLS